MGWNIVLYESVNKKPVEDFIKSLQPATIAKVARQIDLLEEFGVNLSMPNTKPIGNGLHELRIRGKQEVRIIYIFVKEQDIYLLHGFIKKTQAIQTKDLNIALKRKKVILLKSNKSCCKNITHKL